MDFFATRRFLPLFCTQFLGAFNDNLFKNSLVILITYKMTLDSVADPQLLVTLAAGLFILPFFLFSATAGQLADKYDRAKITRIIKIAEIVIMLLASIGFIFRLPWFLLAVLFACGAHSSFFGPIKYALLPQHLHKSELIEGNAYIEAGTFLAILLGTIYGGLTILHRDGVYLVAVNLLLFACLGYFSSRYIPKSPAPDPNLRINLNLVAETMRIVAYSKQNRRVYFGILAISWFWLIGATFLAQFPNYVKNELHAEGYVVTLFFTLFSIGVGCGSFIASKLLKGQIKSTFVPWAAFAITIFIIDLSLAGKAQVYHNLHGLLSIERFTAMYSSWRIIFDIFMLALCAGIYIVPLYAIVQYESEEKYRARIIAANNVFNALFMVMAALVALGVLALGGTVAQVFLCIAITNIPVAVSIYKYL